MNESNPIQTIIYINESKYILISFIDIKSYISNNISLSKYNLLMIHKVIN